MVLNLINFIANQPLHFFGMHNPGDGDIWIGFLINFVRNHPSYDTLTKEQRCGLLQSILKADENVNTGESEEE